MATDLAHPLPFMCENGRFGCNISTRYVSFEYKEYGSSNMQKIKLNL